MHATSSLFGATVLVAACPLFWAGRVAQNCCGLSKPTSEQLRSSKKTLEGENSSLTTSSTSHRVVQKGDQIMIVGEIEMWIDVLGVFAKVLAQLWHGGLSSPLGTHSGRSLRDTTFSPCSLHRYSTLVQPRWRMGGLIVLGTAKSIRMLALPQTSLVG